MATGGGDILNPVGIESDDDDDSEGWSEMNVDSDTSLVCLFCPKPFKTMAVALEHFKLEHSLDLASLKIRFNMDCYSYICLVNYVRRKNLTPDVIASATEPLWNDEQYLVPAMPEDPWLMFDFDGLELPMDSRPASPEAIKIGNGMVTLSEDGYGQLKGTIASLRSLVEQQSKQLGMAAEDIARMQQATQKIVGGINDEDIINFGKLMRITEDFSYFNSYSHFGIHHTMLSDKPRTTSYRDAILKNAESVAGKTVLDVGCGSAILSMFCAQAGAAKVIGVDQSDIIYHAMDIVRENGLVDKIDLLKGRVEEVSLPVEKVDIIVSEWMGYFLLFEGMLDAVLLARDKFLRPNGLMLPNICTMSLVGVSDPESYAEHIGFWSDVYGYRMSSLCKEVLKEAYCTTVNPTTVATTPAHILKLDLNSCTVASTTFTSEFTLVCERECDLTGICGYFDTLFELPQSVTLSTSPFCEKTHWGQTVFYLPQTIHVTQGMCLPGTISCGRKEDNPRSLVIQLQLAGRTNSYFLG